MRIKKDVITQKLAFVAIDSTDHITRKTGLSSFTVYYSLNGGAATAMTTPTVAELDSTNMVGDYTLLVDEAGMTAAAGELILNITASGMDTVTRIVEIVTNLESDNNTLLLDIPTVAEFNARTLASADYVVVGDTIAGVTLVTTCTTNTDMRGTNLAALASVCTEGRLAELDAVNLITDVANVKTDTAAILIDTAVIGALGAGLTAIPWNAAWDAEVQSECNDALVALKLDHLVAVADADDVVNNSIIAKMVSSAATADWSGFVNTTDALQALNTDLDALLTRLPAALTEPTQGAPSATPAPMDALAYLYMFLRNKRTTTAILDTIYADNGTTAIMKATLADDGDALTKSEYISGA